MKSRRLVSSIRRENEFTGASDRRGDGSEMPNCCQNGNGWRSQVLPGRAGRLNTDGARSLGDRGSPHRIALCGAHAMVSCAQDTSRTFPTVSGRSSHRMRLRVAILGTLIEAVESTGAAHTQWYLARGNPRPRKYPQKYPRPRKYPPEYPRLGLAKSPAISRTYEKYPQYPQYPRYPGDADGRACIYS